MIDREQWKAILEALIFAAEEPASLELLAEILELEPPEVESLIAEVRAEYEGTGRGLRLIQVAGGYRFTTRPDYHPWVKLLFKNQKTVRLTRAALQTLAIIAYKQPVTAPEIEEIRSVEASGLLKNLLEKRLVKILGRKDVVGRPILYGTTTEFLLQFGLNDLDDLPSLEEFEELLKADIREGESVEVLEGGDEPRPAAALDPALTVSPSEPDEDQVRDIDDEIYYPPGKASAVAGQAEDDDEDGDGEEEEQEGVR